MIFAVIVKSVTQGTEAGKNDRALSGNRAQYLYTRRIKSMVAMAPQIYFAAPLFSDAERQFNRELTEALEDAGYSVFLPQRDGIENLEAYAEQEEVDGMDDVMMEIFRIDREAVLEADVLTAVLDGQVPDEGVAIEMGIAYEHDIPIVGLKTDRRIFAENEPLNAMLWGVMSDYTESTDEFFELVDSHLSQQSA